MHSNPGQGVVLGSSPRRFIELLSSTGLSCPGKVFRFRAAGSAALTEVSERLYWSSHQGRQVEGKGIVFCLFVYLHGLASNLRVLNLLLTRKHRGVSGHVCASWTSWGRGIVLSRGGRPGKAVQGEVLCRSLHVFTFRQPQCCLRIHTHLEAGT